jgi:hypothetical protein
VRTEILTPLRRFAAIRRRATSRPREPLTLVRTVGPGYTVYNVRRHAWAEMPALAGLDIYD